MTPPAKSVCTSQANILRLNQSSLLTIKVGKEPNFENFTVHESFLTARSEYFRRAMNGHWKEAETRVVELQLEDPKVFTLYANHVYTGHFPIILKIEEKMETLDITAKINLIHEEYHQIARVYVLAERLQDDTTRNAVVTAFVEIFNRGLSTPAIRTVAFAYKKTPPGRPLRRLLVRLWSSLSLSAILSASAMMPKEFLDELGPALEEQRTYWKLPDLKTSEYMENTGVRQAILSISSS